MIIFQFPLEATKSVSDRTNSMKDKWESVLGKELPGSPH